uniref:Bifunctional lysine-specific demethylase and histidyl-hydroxylase NO66 n=1 Tax=Panagrellus redivivus TaxID=6233 RepID=A0A7E4W588_PANRE
MVRRPKTRSQQRADLSPMVVDLDSSNSASGRENRDISNGTASSSARRQNGNNGKVEATTPTSAKAKQNGKPKPSTDSTPDVSLLVDSDDAAPSSSKKKKKKIIDSDETSEVETTPTSSKKGKKSVIVDESPDVIDLDETVESTSSSKRKRRSKKAKQDQATPNGSAHNVENAGNTPLSTYNTSNAGNTPKANGKPAQNGTSRKLSFEDDDEPMDSSIIDPADVDESVDTPSKRKRRRNKKKRHSTAGAGGDAAAPAEDEPVEEVLTNGAKKLKAAEEDEKTDSDEEPAPSNPRKRKAAQRAQNKLALVPAHQRKDDTDPDDTSYFVESPDEDGQPKRARIEEPSEDESDEFHGQYFNADSIRAELNALFNGGDAFRESDVSSDEDLNTSQDTNGDRPDAGYEDSDDIEMELTDSDDPDGLIDDEAEDADEGEDSDESSESLLWDDDGEDDAIYDLNDIGLYSGNDDEISSGDDMFNNTDDEVDNAISTIRPRSNQDGPTEIILDHLYEQGIGHTSDESSDEAEDGEAEVTGPVDDLQEEELEEADDADLHEDDDSGEDLDGFIVDEGELEFLSDGGSGEDAEDEDSSEDTDEDIDMDSEDEADPNDVSDCYKVGEKFKFDVEGYQVHKDRGLLVSVGRTSAPKAKDGPMKVFSFNTELDENSVTVAKNAFNWMIAPAHMETFFSNIFQRRVFHIARRDKKFYDGLFSSDALLRIIQENDLKYGNNINVALYTQSGGRETHNPEGRVFAHQIKQFVEAGMSIQCINPQSYSDTIWYLCEVLQEMTNNFVGANTYLTPADSAGFAPHWDEVDAFVLQTEGSKRWRVWAPLDGDEALPDESSRNFTEQEMKSRDVVWEGTLHAGDMLYIPRGFYHAAYSMAEEHSLHVTVSFCHNVTFTHLLKGITDEVWHSVRQSRLLARRSVPPHFLEMNGVANLDYDSKYDEQMLPVINTILEDLVDTYREAVPSAVDNLALEFYRQALPPMLSPEEAEASIHGSAGLKMFEDSPLTISRMKEIRFIRMHAQRLLYQTEDDPFIVHRMSNSRVLSENTEPQTIKIETKMVDGVLTLFKEYPGWIKVKDLGCGKHVNIELANLLFQAGLIMVREAK